MDPTTRPVNVTVLIPPRWPEHWRMVSDAVQDIYASDLLPDDVLIFGLYLRKPISEFRQQYPGRRIIVYQAEPLLGSEHYWPSDSIVNNIKEADEIWDYDFQNYCLLQQRGLPVSFRPLTYSPKSRADIQCPVQDIDVLVYGLFSERRGQWLHKLHMGMNPDKKIYTVCNVMHPEIDYLIQRSRVIVNWHQHPDQLQQQQTRLFYLLCNGKQVVSERSTINYYGDLIQEFDTSQEMIDQINHLIHNQDHGTQQQIHDRFRDLTWQDVWSRAQVWYQKQ